MREQGDGEVGFASHPNRRRLTALLAAWDPSTLCEGHDSQDTKRCDRFPFRAGLNTHVPLC
jgi:hypothetical protein